MPHKDIYRNGVKLVSVTELQRIVAKPYLDTWKESLCVPGQVCGFDAARHVAEEAADMGNKTHEYVELTLKGIPPPSPDAWGARIVDKINEMGISKCLLDPEETIIDEESGLAGSPDFIGTCNEGMFIGDLKVKNQIDANTDDQGCGYRYLIRRKFDVDIKKMLIFWCQKKSVKQTVKPVWIDLDSNQAAWEALVMRWNKANPKRSVKLLG